MLLNVQVLQLPDHRGSSMQSLAKMAFEDGKTADISALAASSHETEQPQQDANCQDAQDQSACAVKGSAWQDISEEAPTTDVPADLSLAHQQVHHDTNQNFRHASGGISDAAAKADNTPITKTLSSNPALPLDVEPACEQEADQAFRTAPPGPLPEVVMPGTGAPQTLPAAAGQPAPKIDPGPHMRPQAAPSLSAGTHRGDRDAPDPAVVVNTPQSRSPHGKPPGRASPQQGRPAGMPVPPAPPPEVNAQHPPTLPALASGSPVKQADPPEAPFHDQRHSQPQISLALQRLQG